MADQTLRFDIIGDDRASAAFSRAGASAGELSRRMDAAARSSKVLDDALERQRIAARVSADATLSLAKADEILKEAEHGLRDGVLEAEFAVKRDTEAKKRNRDATLEAAAAEKAYRDELGKRGRLLLALSGRTSGGGGLLSMLSGGGGGAGGAGSLFSGGLTSPAGLAGLGAGGALLAALAPGLIGLGIGGGVGALGVGGSLAAASYLNEQVKKAQAALKAAQAKNAPAGALPVAQANLAEARQMAAPFTGLTSSLHGLGETAIMTFARSVGPLLKGLTPVFDGLGRQLKTLAPLMTQMFSASLPFIKTFAGLLAPIAKTLMPAFTDAMNQMVKSGALKLMAQGIAELVKGLAGFITALGPGMKSSAILFKGLAVVISDTMVFAGKAVSWLANVIEDYFHRARLNIHQWASVFDDFRHRTAVVFDGMRHEIAHVWDVIWNETNGRIIRGVHDVQAWFNSLPGRITGALGKAGSLLFGWGKGVIQGLMSGFGSVWDAVKNFFTGLPKKILGWLGIHSPPQWAIDAGKHIMNGLGIGMKAAHKAVWNASAGVAGTVMAGVAGPASASAGQAQAYAASRLGAFGWSSAQMKPLILLWDRESGWNRFARNPSSGAYGIPQALPPGKMGAAANPPTSSAAAQINWGLSYIAGRYGSPAGAWAHELSAGWYDQGGILPSRSIGINTTPGPEVVLTQRQWSDLHRLLIEFVRDARHREEPRWLIRWVRGNDQQLSALARAHQKIAATIAAAQGYAAQKTAAFTSYAGLAGVIGATAPPAVSGRDIFLGLRQKLANLQAFSSVIRSLSQRHLSRALLQQIIEMGPDDGLAYGRAILSATGAIGQLNATETAIGKAARAAGMTSADALYDSGRFAGKGYLTGLMAQQHHIDASMRMIASRMERALQPATVNYHINVRVHPGAEAEAGREIVALIRAFEKRSGKSWRS